MNQIAVELGAATELKIKLQLTIETTIVNVTEPSDQPSATALSSTITEAEINRLPVNGRNWQTFALLTPTANSGDQLLSVRGQPATQNSTSIDGASDDQSFAAVPRGTSNATESEENEEDSEPGGATRNAGSRSQSGAAHTFSQEAVREFRAAARTTPLSTATQLAA
jgi:hypothetical protein